MNQKQNGWYVRLRNANWRSTDKDITAQTLGISFDPDGSVECCMGHRP